MRLLTSWKEIASYLGRTTRTVQRWESSLHLPIHRMGAASSGIVYAFREEIDQWLADSHADAPIPHTVKDHLHGCTLDLFVEALPNIAWIADVNGLVEFVNQRWNEYTGQSVANPFPSGMLEAVHPDDLPSASGLWKAAVTSGEPFEARYRIRAKDGHYRWFVARANLLCDKKGAFAKWIGTCTDIHAYHPQMSHLKSSETSAS